MLATQNRMYTGLDYAYKIVKHLNNKQKDMIQINSVLKETGTNIFQHFRRIPKLQKSVLG
jgi:anti-sigma regulatory factor (Ser/Thr protein kinase)